MTRHSTSSDTSCQMAPERKAGDFGVLLREARERRGIGLRQIANTTKISVRALEALERNDISQLPGGIFSRSFVRAYALQIGLDPEVAVAEFVRQFPHDSVIVGHAPSSHHDRDAAVDLERRSRRFWWWVVALLAVIAIVGGYFVGIR